MLKILLSKLLLRLRPKDFNFEAALVTEDLPLHVVFVVSDIHDVLITGTTSEIALDIAHESRISIDRSVRRITNDIVAHVIGQSFLSVPVLVLCVLVDMDDVGLTINSICQFHLSIPNIIGIG